MERQASHERGSMLVQYNCSQYECEPDLVGRLTEIVRDYPPYVCLAPYSTPHKFAGSGDLAPNFSFTLHQGEDKPGAEN